MKKRIIWLAALAVGFGAIAIAFSRVQIGLQKKFARIDSEIASMAGRQGRSAELRQAISHQDGTDEALYIVTRVGHACIWISVGFSLAVIAAAEFSREKQTPNQPPEPTGMLGTSAAEPPRVPSTPVAHL